MEDAARIDRRDRAAAGREACDVEAAQRNALPGQTAVGRQRDAAIGNQRNIGRGAAHVEGDEIGNTQHVGAAAAAGHAAGWSRQHGGRRKPRRLFHRRHAAVGEDDEERACEAGLDEALLQPRQIAPHHWLDIGVHDRGRDALIFLDLRQHVDGARDIDVRKLTEQALACGDLMRGIAIGMQETDRNRGRAGCLDRSNRFAERVRVERYHDLAIRPQPLAHAKAQFARHQRLRRRGAQIVAVALQPFAHLQHVAMARRRRAARPWRPCAPAAHWSPPWCRAPAAASAPASARMRDRACVRVRPAQPSRRSIGPAASTAPSQIPCVPPHRSRRGR